MKRSVCALVLFGMTGIASAQVPAAPAAPVDPRIRTVIYSADAVVQVPVSHGVVTHIVLNDDETITSPPATGKGADCARETDTWCIAAMGRDIFVKPKTGATRNNMVIVSTRRRHAFDLVVLPEGGATRALMRLVVQVPRPVPPPAPVQVDYGPAPLSIKQLVDNRMSATPLVRNAQYSVAVGANSEDIVPVMVFDNGVHTFFSFPNNRPLPTVFETSPDTGEGKREEMVNVRMDADGQLLVADRVARRFVLRLGNSVVAVINEAFDLDGVAPNAGTVTAGVQRAVRPNALGPLGVPQ